MARGKEKPAPTLPVGSEPVVEKEVGTMPVVSTPVAAPSVVKVLSMRAGDIGTTCGDLKYGVPMELPIAEAERIAACFKQWVKIL